MIQPNSNAFSYGPFRGAFVFGIMTVTAWIVLFVLTTQYCSTNCLSYTTFYNPCVSSGNLYCCSTYSSGGMYYCGFYNSCLLDNTSCGGVSTGSWVAGSLAILAIIFMVLAAMKFRRLKQLAMINMQNQNNQYANINPNAPIYYPPNQQFSNQQFPNQPYPNQQNNNQQYQNNYVPPRYYPQT